MKKGKPRSFVKLTEEKDLAKSSGRLTDKIVSNIANSLNIPFNDPRIISKLALLTGVPLNGKANDVLAAVADIIRKEKKVPFVYYTGAGTLKVGFRKISSTSETILVPGESFTKPRLMLLYTYALTTFPDEYGAGRIVSTFSLLPNEKTKITMRTWKTSEVVSKQASSTFDSYNVDTYNELESSIQNEITNRDLFKESIEWRLPEYSAEISVIGVFSAGASIKGGPEKSTEREIENSVKNMQKALSKYTASVSSKRSIEIKTSFETKVTAGEENLIERELENVNAGRVLNFVFRQLQQNYLTYIHLVDVKVAFVYTDPDFPNYPLYSEYNLPDLEDFLESHLNEIGSEDNTKKKVNPRDEVRKWIVGELGRINDYKNRPLDIIECIDVTSGKTKPLDDYLDRSKRLDADGKQKLQLRIVKEKYYQNENPNNKESGDNNDNKKRPPYYEKYVVDGIILAKTEQIMPTDSVIVEALLGQSEALDKYSIESRRAVVDLKRTEIDKMNLAEEVVREEEEKKADIFEKVYPPPKTIIKEGD